MNALFRFGVVFAAAVSLASAAGSESLQRAAYLLTFGKAPSESESIDSNQSTAALISDWRHELAKDPALASTARHQAWRDSFGTDNFRDAETDRTSESLPYWEQMERHTAHLQSNPAEYRRVIGKAYRYLLSRDPYDAELDYWAQRPTAPFVIIVSCLENWARRNQPGLMVTSGMPTVSSYSRFMHTVTVSRAEALALAEQLGPKLDLDREVTSSSGHNFIGAGSSLAVTDGHRYFAGIGHWDNALAPSE